MSECQKTDTKSTCSSVSKDLSKSHLSTRDKLPPLAAASTCRY